MIGILLALALVSQPLDDPQSIYSWGFTPPNTYSSGECLIDGPLNIQGGALRLSPDAPTYTVSGKVSVYAKNAGGVAKLYMKDGAGLELRVPDPERVFLGGSLGAGVLTSCVPIKWLGKGTTTSGVVTMYPTHNNTSGGNPLFSSIIAAVAVATADTASAPDVPGAAIKAIATDRKSITVNVSVGKSGLLASLVDSAAFAPNGTEVTVMAWGCE